MITNACLFNPKSYENVRRPLLEAETLPPWCYTSPEFYAREVERIFKRAWNFIGRADHIPNTGDYYPIKFAGIPLVIVRQETGEVRAFLNSCRHRGTLLVTESGNCRSFRCPYHSWVYKLSGELAGASGMEDSQNFDKGRYGLVEFPLESWEGFYFIAFRNDVGSLREYLGELPALLASYNFSNMQCTRRKTFDLSCNWKIYIENAMENYHVPTVHRKSLKKQESTYTLCWPEGGQFDYAHLPSERSEAILHDDTTTFPHIPTLAGKAAHGTYFVLIYPSTMFGCTQDCMWWLELHPNGPHRTTLIVGSCFPRETIARADFGEVVPRYYRRWDESIPEDNTISERQQAGLCPSFTPPGRFASREILVHRIANWVLDRVIDSDDMTSATWTA